MIAAAEVFMFFGLLGLLAWIIDALLDWHQRRRTPKGPVIVTRADESMWAKRRRPFDWGQD